MAQFSSANVRFNSKVYRCSKCENVLFNPVQLNDCGHKLCRNCFDGSLSSLERSPTCTVCGSFLLNPQFHDDKCLREEISNLMIVCKGCHVEFALQNFWDNHASVCPPLQVDFQSVTCGYCQHTMPKHQLRTHQLLYCWNVNQGYPVDVEQINRPDNFAARYACKRCAKMFSIGFQCDGIHRFCFHCFPAKSCPQCGSTIYFIDNALSRDVDGSSFKCSSEGCTSRDMLEQIRVHEDSCPLRNEYCNICGTHHRFNLHTKEVFKCPKCGDLFLVEVKEQHLAKCIPRLILCKPCGHKAHMVDEPHLKELYTCLDCNTLIELEDYPVHELECQGTQPL